MVTHHVTTRVIVCITGRVQGVHYRATAKRNARRLGLSGWARNEPDGSVTIDVEGDPAAVDMFLEWCAVGPPGAHVLAVETTVANPAGYEDFSIERFEEP